MKEIISTFFIILVLNASASHVDKANIFCLNVDTILVDSLIGVDTLEVFDKWLNSNFEETRSKRYVEWHKGLFCGLYGVEFSARSFDSDGKVTNKTIKVNGKTFDIDKELSKNFGKDLAKRFDFLEGPVTAKRYPNSMQIDFVLYYKDCCCDFCNDVEIASLMVSNSGDARIWMHGENFEEYE